MRVRPHIAALTGYLPGEQPQGGKYIKLNTNENPYPPSPKVAQAIQAAVERGLQKYPDPFANAFRTRAADILGVEASWIICGNGSDDILTILTRSFVGEGEWLRLPYPSYILYRTLAELQGAHAEEIRFRDDWSLGDDFAERREGLRLAFLPNPNSPSGTFIPREQVWRLAEQLSCPLLVDEAYVDFADDDCIELVRRSDRVMVSRTLSKSYALAGLRFGFLMAQPHVIEQLMKVKDSYNCDALSIAGATAAMDDQTWRMENQAKLLRTRERLTAGLHQLGFSMVPSQANFVWCAHPARSAKAIYESLKANQVLVRYMNYPNWGDGLRITVGTDDQIDACLELLKAMV